MNSALLMPRQDKFYRAVIEDIKDRQDRPSWITKKYLHILFEKRLYNYLPAGLFNFYFPPKDTIISDAIYLASKIGLRADSLSPLYILSYTIKEIHKIIFENN